MTTQDAINEANDSYINFRADLESNADENNYVIKTDADVVATVASLDAAVEKLSDFGQANELTAEEKDALRYAAAYIHVEQAIFSATIGKAREYANKALKNISSLQASNLPQGPQSILPQLQKNASTIANYPGSASMYAPTWGTDSPEGDVVPGDGGPVAVGGASAGASGSKIAIWAGLAAVVAYLLNK